MNEWLRSAERTKNNDRMRTLLTQCLEANVTIELLEKSRTDAETSMPKFIQQLSKKSKDVGVSKLAAEIVSKWKKVRAKLANLMTRLP
jgi:TFIIS helical bundle-like domain